MNQHIAYSRIKAFVPRYDRELKRKLGKGDPKLLDHHGVHIYNLPDYAWKSLLLGILDGLDGIENQKAYSQLIPSGMSYSEQQWYNLGRTVVE